MDNPMRLMLWANVNVMYQYWRFSKNTLDVFFPVPTSSQRPAPAMSPATVTMKRGGCVGPADLRP